MAKAAKAKPKGDRARLAELLEEVDEHWAALSREEITDYVQGAVAETGIPRAEVEVALSEAIRAAKPVRAPEPSVPRGTVPAKLAPKAAVKRGKPKRDPVVDAADAAERIYGGPEKALERLQEHLDRDIAEGEKIEPRDREVIDELRRRLDGGEAREAEVCGRGGAAIAAHVWGARTGQRTARTRTRQAHVGGIRTRQGNSWSVL
jgi:hypothetical protein